MNEEKKLDLQEEQTYKWPPKQASGIGSWEKVDIVLGHPYCKINSGESRDVTFLDNNPTEKTSSINGREVTVFDLTVSSGGKKMVLSVTSKGLLRQIRAAAMIAPLSGRTFTISATGDGMQKRYTMTEVKNL